MKSVALSTAALCAMLAPALHAQLATLDQKPSKLFSIGGEGVLPNGAFSDQASFGAGPAVGIEFPMGSRSAITIQFACDFMTPANAEESFESWTMLPLQIGGKFYFEESQAGLHADIMAGTHNQYVNTTETDEGATLSVLHTSWGAGLGYQWHKLDVSARYNMIIDNIDGANWSYVGLRLAYLIHLGKKTA